MSAIEWPPGSGRMAAWSADGLAVARYVIVRLKGGLRHRAGCPGRDADAYLGGIRDLEGCDFCRAVNQVDVLHELFMLGAVSASAAPGPPEPEGVQIELPTGRES